MEEWEEPLHPDPMARTVLPLSPTKQPQSHKKSHRRPLFAPPLPRKAPCSSGFARRSAECQTNVHIRQSVVQTARSAMCPADEGRFCPAGVPPTICPVTTTLSLSPRRLAVLAAAALAIPIAGCGSSDSSSSGNTDPAKAIPASAPFYLEATVRPTGQQRTDLEAALRKILRTDDPGAKITELIDKEASKDGGEATTRTSSRGSATRPPSRHRPRAAPAADWAVVINSTDDAKASDSLSNEQGYSDEAQLRGHRLPLRPARTRPPQAVVKGFAVIGDRAGLQAGRRRARQGRRLAGVQRRPAGRAREGRRPPGFMFVDLQSLLRSAVGQRRARRSARRSCRRSTASSSASARSAWASAPTPQAIRMSLATIGDGSRRRQRPGLVAAARQGAGQTRGWRSRRATSASRSRACSTRSRTRAPSDQITQLETATGLNVKEDLLSWMGDAALFVEGDSVPALGGALVVAVDRSGEDARGDHARSRGCCASSTSGSAPAPAGTSAGFSMRTRRQGRSRC